MIPTHCPVLGFPLKTGGNGGSGDDSASLDRLVPELGYVRGNVIVVSHLANSIRRNATPEQLRAVADFYERLMEDHENRSG